MTSAFQAVPIADNVDWVGAIDWSIRDFHGYLTDRGSSYNAFLVRSDKIALIDTVKGAFADELFARIASVVEPGEIDYIVANHAEFDHSGALARAIDLIKPEKVFTSARGVEALQQHLGSLPGLTAVGDGETIPLGDLSLTCVETRLCHWPESMVTYVPEQGVLFSQDIFGLHLASYERFDDQLPLELLDREAEKYFANILMPLSTFVGKGLDRLRDLNLAIKVLAPDHGPIRRTHIQRIVEQYARWAQQPRRNKAVVICDTMWGSSDLMARAVGEGLAAGGTQVRMMPVGKSGCHRSEIATEMLDAGGLVVAAPTLNNEIFPSLLDVLGYLKGLKPKGLLGAALGSFGWSGEAVKDLRDLLTDMKVELVDDDPIRARYVPDAAVLAQCRDLGTKLSAKLKAKFG
ncbi:MAG: FprA family A-type flavoprotein [Phycisphaerae bacterium]|nr:FprA family A-type flavoprotein [Phycisphaerae bacterium]